LQKWDKFYKRVNIMHVSTSSPLAVGHIEKAHFVAILGAKY
jgi:hypothetical protein